MTLNPNHRQEWLDSGVDPEIIALNVKSLSGDAAYEHLLHGLPDSERRNDGRLRDYRLRQYRHLDNGGWWCSGVDILTGEDALWGCFKPNTPRHSAEGKLIKYEHPPKVETEVFALRVSFLNSCKIARRSKNEVFQTAWLNRFSKCLEAVVQEATETISSRVTDGEVRTNTHNPRSPSEIGIPDNKESFDAKCLRKLQKACARGELRKISAILHAIRNQPRHCAAEPPRSNCRGIERLAKLEDREFWRSVRELPIPVTITEGAKKAGTLLTRGYVAIALPGIFNGYRSKDGQGNPLITPTLIPQLEVLAIEGRELTICFDHDTKPKTAANVRIATEKTGKLFELKGCKVFVTSWGDLYPDAKGIDDILVGYGTEAVDRIFANRLSLGEYKLAGFRGLTCDLKINERFIPESLTVPRHIQLIGLKSPKGTGKTEYLAKQVQPSLGRGDRVILIGHREQLLMELSRRFGIDYRTELRTSETKGILGFASCIDSLHPKANPPFKPQDWEGATVIIDEVEQVLWHVLNGDTCRQNRVKILESFRELLETVVRTGGKIYCADSDLTNDSLNYLKRLIGFPVPTYVVQNTYKSEVKKQLFWFEGNTPEQLITRLVRAIEDGEKPFIFTDGQKHKSTWGTRNLEHYLKKRFPHLKVLRIDRDSVSDKKHPAYGCMGRLNEVLGQYDIVIASPTVETGVSINIPHFTSVWGISHGVQTVDSVAQALERVRDSVPRYLWARETSVAMVSSGETELRKILASNHRVTQANIQLLQKAGLGEFNDLGFVEDSYVHSPSLTTWAKRACVVNFQNKEFRKNLLKKLESEGYELVEAWEDQEDSKLTKEAVKASKKAIYGEHCQQVETQQNPSDSEYAKLKEQRARTEDELIALKKGKLCRRYLTEEIDAGTIQKDDEGWFPQLLLHYYLSIGNRFLKDRDRAVLSKLAEEGEGKVFKPDVNESLLSAKVEALKLLGIESFLDPSAEFSNEDLSEWFEKINNPLSASQIRSILGVTVSQKSTPISVAQRLLKKIGLKLEFDHWERTDGKARRIYRGANPDPDGRGEVYGRWFDRDLEKEEVKSVAF